jgi:hypothetical protein
LAEAQLAIVFPLNRESVLPFIKIVRNKLGGFNMSIQHFERAFQWPLQRIVLQGYSVRLVPVDYSHLDQLSRWSGRRIFGGI